MTLREQVLLHEPGQLASTDMPEYAVDALRRSQIDTVHIVGRRGPAQASFTNKEVREILNLPGVQCHFLPSGVLALNEASKAETAKERGKKRMIDLFAATEKKVHPRLDCLSQLRFFSPRVATWLAWNVVYAARPGRRRANPRRTCTSTSSSRRCASWPTRRGT
jgi:hypothetical protein